MSMTVSVIIPALNEEALIFETLESVHRALCVLPPAVTAEVIVVDNGSTDHTRRVVEKASSLVRLLDCPSKGAARARNLGARCSRGDILVFLDADTTIPEGSINDIVEQCSRNGITAGMTKLGPRDGGFRACCWWFFWNSVRRLPLPRAKAMPAFMFCTRSAFEELGPFNEDVAIGEEWPILAEIYRTRRNEFIYLRSITAWTSSRRMELISFGYARLFLKYVWAILDYRGRVHYSATIRHRTAAFQDAKPAHWNSESQARDLR
jgi:glycosyltransferase involved in cell wall biosynthesis